MSSKETIFEALKANSPAPVERGPLDFTPMTFSDPLAEFRERAVKAAAARCILIEEEDGSIQERIASIVRRTYPEAKRIASNLPEAASCATFNPDELEDPRELNGTDVSVVKGEFGVAENAAVWLPCQYRYKAVYFISNALVILLDRQELVNNMNESYRRITNADYSFGVFMSGPSKTADIEQALVFGAHGPIRVTVILI